MGNAIPCLAGRTVVKVMLPDSTIERYDHAVKVAELAAKYPNYAVVHCSTAKPSLGQLRAVIVMKRDECLVPGQAYILYPIPKSFNDSVHTSRDTETSPEINHSSDPEIVGGETKTKTDSELLTAEDLEQSLSMTLMGPAMRKVPSQVPGFLEIEEKKERNEKKEIADFAVESCTWTPDLYQIWED